MTLQIHLPTNSGSGEWDFFLRLFRNYVYHHSIFPKINKGGIKAGGVRIFFKNIIRYSRVRKTGKVIRKVPFEHVAADLWKKKSEKMIFQKQHFLRSTEVSKSSSSCNFEQKGSSVIFVFFLHFKTALC